MGARNTVRMELDEQRCLIEQQQIKIERQQRKIELQLRLIAHMQTELDRIHLTLERGAPVLGQRQASSRDGNGNGQVVAIRRERGAVSESVCP